MFTFDALFSIRCIQYKSCSEGTRPNSPRKQESRRAREAHTLAATLYPTSMIRHPRTRARTARWLVGTLFAVAFGLPAAAQAPLGSTVFPPDSARSRKSSAASIQRSIVDSLTANLSKLEMHETTVPAGGAPHAPHRHVHEELMIIRSGTMEVLQGTVTRTAVTGSVVFMASNEWHGLKNPGTVPATYLIVTIYPHDLPKAAPSSTTPPAATSPK